MGVSSGTTLGRYRLIERAGTGGMSEVWRAEDGTLHRSVAVKVILDPIARDAGFAERFLREARLVAGLEHPSILPVYDFGAASVDGAEVSYLVMPLVTGGSLKERMRGGVPVETAVAWLAAMAAGLDHAHAKGILHRDIKPGNILLDASSRALLADFGLARSAESVSGLTATGTVLGTPLYMAPEQASGKPLDARADQYALAVVAFELVTGSVPFRADSPLAILHQHVATPPPAPSSLRPGLSPAVDAAFARALSKEPERRYASCAEFVTALATALGVPSAAGVSFAGASAVTEILPGGPVRAGVSSLPPALATDAPSRAATVASGPAAGPELLAAPASVPAGGSASRRALVAAAVVLFAGGLAAAGWYLLRPRPETTAETAAQLPITGPTPPAAAPPTTSRFPETSSSSVAEPAIATPSPAPLEPAVAPVEIVPTVPAARTAPPPPTTAAAVARESHEPPHRPEPLLGARAGRGDARISSALDALDSSRKPAGRLERADFVEALGSVRSSATFQTSGDGRFLDAFGRAGVAFADGKSQEAWLLLRRAFEESPNAGGRRLRFVRSLMTSRGNLPGRDGGWILGLAFADVRGDLAEELDALGERAPGSAELAYARALVAFDAGQVGDARRHARAACADGLREACDLSTR